MSLRWGLVIGVIVAAIVTLLVLKQPPPGAPRSDGGAAEAERSRDEAAERARVIGSGEKLSPRAATIARALTDGGAAQVAPPSGAGRGAPGVAVPHYGAAGVEAGGGGAGPPPSGPVSKEAIQAAVRAAMPKLADCFNQHLVREPDAGAATVSAKFEIVAKDGKGHIESAELGEGSLGNPADDLCLMNALGQVDFPIPQGANEVRYRVTYPFHFAP